MKGNEQKIILTIVSVLIIVLFVLSVVSKTVVKEEDLTEEQKLELIARQQNERTIDYLADLKERDRIEYYVSEFIGFVDNEKYEQAYELLNDDFKANYFETQEDFEKYVKAYFPREIALKHTNIERNGNTYILWTTMSNALGTKNSGKNMNFVVKEYALNDYELSFSADQK